MSCPREQRVLIQLTPAGESVLIQLMALTLHLDPSARTPLYRQLAEQLSASILDGTLAAGSRLPSVREMAIEQRVNPNTVARAYREIDLAGLVNTQAGRGVFVTEAVTGDPEKAARSESLAQAVDLLLKVAREHSLNLDQVVALLRQRANSARVPEKNDDV